MKFRLIAIVGMIAATVLLAAGFLIDDKAEDGGKPFLRGSQTVPIPVEAAMANSVRHLDYSWADGVENDNWIDEQAFRRHSKVELARRIIPIKQLESSAFVRPLTEN